MYFKEQKIKLVPHTKTSQKMNTEKKIRNKVFFIS